MTESVNVEAEAPTINTTDAAMGNAFTQTQVRQLPLQTRNVVELLSLQPGVTPTGEVMGARRDQNNIMLDGVDVNDNQDAGIAGSTIGDSRVPTPTAPPTTPGSLRCFPFRSIPSRSFE